MSKISRRNFFKRLGGGVVLAGAGGLLAASLPDDTFAGGVTRTDHETALDEMTATVQWCEQRLHEYEIGTRYTFHRKPLRSLVFKQE